MSEFSTKEKSFILLGILLALFLGALDQTIVATALPKIVEDLHGLDRYSWVATAYLVASTALVPIYGKLADTYSRKKIELTAITIFLSGSFLCGIAGEFGSLPVLGNGMNQLIIFRAIQGLGSAGLFAMAFIVIADLFPPAERGKYQGFIGAVFGIASILGPWLGGFLTDHGDVLIPGVAGWRWVFYVNLPFGIIALWFIIANMPSLIPKGNKQPLNYLSAFLLITGIVPFITFLQLDRSKQSWFSPLSLVLLVISILSTIFFVIRTKRSENPLLDLKLLNNKVFKFSIGALFLLGAAFFSIIIFFPLFMVDVVGVSATKAGMSLIPLSLGIVTGSVVSGQLVSRFGHYTKFMLGGVVILFCAVLIMSHMPADIKYWEVLALMALCGLGMGPSMPLYTLAIQNAVDIRNIGQATSASQFFRQIGAAIGSAAMGAVLTTSLLNSFTEKVPEGEKGISMLRQVHFSVEDLKNMGGPNISNVVHREFDRQYHQLKEYLADKNNSSAKDSLLNNVFISDTLKKMIKQGTLDANNLDPIKESMEAQQKTAIANMHQAISESFAKAIRHIYFYTLFFVAGAWMFTWFIPELPLRKTIS